MASGVTPFRISGALGVPSDNASQPQSDGIPGTTSPDITPQLDLTQNPVFALLQFQANNITRTQITDNAIDTPQLAANSITANEISAGAIDGLTIKGNIILGAFIEGGEIVASTFVTTDQALSAGGPNQGIAITSTDKDTIYFYTGSSSELDVAKIAVTIDGLVISGTGYLSTPAPFLSLGAGFSSDVVLEGTNIALSAGTLFITGLSGGAVTVVMNGDLIVDDNLIVQSAPTFNSTTDFLAPFLRPVVGHLSALPSSGTSITTSAADYTTGQFSRPSVVVGSSGMLMVEFFQEGYNSNTTTSTLWLTARLTGTATIAASVVGTDASRLVGSPGGAGSTAPMQAYGKKVFTGLTPGAYTVIPQWFGTAGSWGTTASLTDAQVIATPLP